MTYKTYILTSVALATVLSACTDEISADFYNPASSSLAARKMEKAEVTSRADNSNTIFDVGTAYKLWAYGNTNLATVNFADSKFSNIEGTESSSHYVTLPGQYANKIKGNIHIYGFTDGTDKPVSDMSDTAFSISLPATGDYTDYMAGYLHYDSGSDEFKESSYAVIPFGHIMSQVNVKVVQYGEVSYYYEGDEVIYDTKESYEDLKIKKISLKNAYTGANYCLQGNSFSNYSGKETVRELWSKETPMAIPVEIPEQQEDGKPVTSNLVLPQSPSNTDKMQLELVICGDDAAGFANENNTYTTNGSDVIITLDLDNNTTDDGQTVSNALQLLSNYSYTLVVTFQSDNVRVVTIAPLIYPFFQGEGDTTKDYQEQAFEQPSVFDNLQWCDRYTGADWGYPTKIAEFQKSAGFYYQKNRTIPFYPTRYVDYSIVDNEYWPKNESEMEKGDKWFKTDGGGDWNGGWQWKGGKIYYRYGGQWEDVEPEAMFNFPKVRPVVSFWLPEEMEITGLKQNPGANYEDTSWELAKLDAYFDGIGRPSVFWNSPENGEYLKEGPNRYCRTVQEFIADDGVSIRTYWSYVKPGYNPETGKSGWYPVNKRLNWAMQIEKDDLPQYRTWDANTEEADLPCPPGWRLPTKQDFLSVFPGSAAAGNLTFLDFLSFGDDISTIAPLLNNEATILKDPENTNNPLLEIYVKTPFNVLTENEETNPSPRLDPPLRVLITGGGYRQLDPLTDMVVWDNGTSTIKRQLLSREDMGDPMPGYESEYVISKRKFTSEEYTAYGISSKGVTSEKYTSYASKVKGMIARPDSNLNNYEPRFIGNDATWGVIYAIKKVGTNEAYRLRYRIEKIQNTDAYVLVVEQYKAYKSDRLKYKIEDINDKQYFLKYSWDYPDATLYFPITGMVGDAPCINGQVGEEDKWVCAVFNYGTETILLSNEYENDEKNQAVLRIKIGGTNTQNQFIFQGMARLGLGGQVRAVRSFRTGGD